MVNYWKWINYISGFLVLAVTLSFSYEGDRLWYLTDTFSIHIGYGPLLSILANLVRAGLGLLIIFDGYKMRDKEESQPSEMF